MKLVRLSAVAVTTRGGELVLTVAEAAKQARVSQSLIYAWCKDGVLTHARLGRPGKRGTIRIDQNELMIFLESMKVCGVAHDESDLKHII